MTDGSIATGTNADTLTVVTSHDGLQEIDIAKANLIFLATTDGIGAISSPGTSGGIQVGTQADATAAIDLLDTAIQNLATLRANNGSEQVRLTFAADMLSVNKTNLEAANGRIVDVDIAAESANLARLNILQQAGTAMLAQANQSNQSLLRLLV
jgi:flagellin